MEKTHTSIEQVILKRKRGELIFITDFRGMGTDVAIRKALSRLTLAEKINRLTHGIYYIPQIDPILGELKPGADEVVRILARKEKIKVRPAGAYALHRLGLTNQVPTKRVYITDGASRQFKFGKLIIKFKSTTPKKLATTGKISSLLIQALSELDIKQIDKKRNSRIRELLEKEDPKKLKHDLRLAPAKVSDYIVRILGEINNAGNL